MTENNITPPPDLLHNWCQELKINGERVDLLLIKAARWGADQELEACCAVVRTVYGKLMADWLRSMRRPKPPSLKEQALKRLAEAELTLIVDPDGTIRRALEALPE